jgi:tight adherence protein B
MTLLAFAVAIAVVAALAVAVGRDMLGQLRDRRHLDRLTTGDPDADDGTLVRPGRLERRLRATGLKLDPLTFLAATAVLALLVLLAVQDLMPETPAAALIAAALAAGGVWLAVGWIGKRRARRFEALLGDAVSLMIGALKAGENLTQSFATAAEASIGTVRKEFGEVARRLGIGMTVRRAIRPIAEGYDSRGILLFTQTVIAKAQAGGDLAPVLEAVNHVIRERLRLRWRLERHLAAARLAAVMMSVIPYLLIPFYLWQQPGWLERLFVHPLGQRLVFGAVILQLLSIWWLRRILRVEL